MLAELHRISSCGDSRYFNWEHQGQIGRWRGRGWEAGSISGEDLDFPEQASWDPGDEERVIWRVQTHRQTLQRHRDKCHGTVGLRRKPSVEGFFLSFLCFGFVKAGGTIQCRTEVEYAIEEERVQHSPGERWGRGCPRCALVCTGVKILKQKKGTLLKGPENWYGADRISVLRSTYVWKEETSVLNKHTTVL